MCPGPECEDQGANWSAAVSPGPDTRGCFVAKLAAERSMPAGGSGGGDSSDDEALGLSQFWESLDQKQKQSLLSIRKVGEVLSYQYS